MCIIRSLFLSLFSPLLLLLILHLLSADRLVSSALDFPQSQPYPSLAFKSLIYKLFPINFLFVKLNHHLLGLSLPSS